MTGFHISFDITVILNKKELLEKYLIAKIAKRSLNKYFAKRFGFGFAYRNKRKVGAHLNPPLFCGRHYSVTSGEAFGSKGFVLMAKEKR